MKYSTLSAFAFSAIVAVTGSVLPKRTPAERYNMDDTTILNYALTLEHLENAFYSSALERFSEADFAAAGMPRWVRPRFVQIGDHEKAHVAFLSSALGDNATQPCTYSFPYTDPKSFAALSSTLEGVGVSAYAGAAQYIKNKDYLTAAAVVLSTEARHSAWVDAAVKAGSAWSGALDVPLDLNEVYTLAASFITSCPSTNPTLPVRAFPTLTLTPVSPPLMPGGVATVAYPNSNTRLSSAAAFVAFFTGLTQTFVPIVNGQVTIPDGLAGTVYAVVSMDGHKVKDATTRAGPAILKFPVPA